MSDLWAIRRHCIKTGTSWGTLPEVTACGHSSLCHPQMQVKALSGREAICERDPETLLSSLGQSSFKMDSGQADNCSEVRYNIYLLPVLSSRAPYGPIQTPFFREGLCGSERQCKTAAIGTLWLCSRWVWVLTFHQQSSGTWSNKTEQSRPELESSIRQEWDKYSSARSPAALLSFPKFRVCCQKNRCYTVVNMALPSNPNWAKIFF